MQPSRTRKPQSSAIGCPTPSVMALPNRRQTESNIKRNITDEFVMEPCGEHPMVQVEAGQWHSLEVLEEGAVLFEAKNGKYEPLAEEDIMKLLNQKKI